jgi:hypothetical protein
MSAAAPTSPQAKLMAARVHQQIVNAASAAMSSLVPLVRQHLDEQMRAIAPAPESRARREAWLAFDQFKSRWRDGTVEAWEKALNPDTVRHSITAPSSLELLDTEVLEHKIIASRLANELMEAAAKDVNHLRRRLKSLAGDQELAASDLVHPEVLLLPVVAQWEGAGLSRGNWERVQPLIHAHFKEHLQAVYTKCNAELIEQGVLPHIEQPAPRSNPSTGASASEGSGLSATGDARSDRVRRQTGAVTLAVAHHDAGWRIGHRASWSRWGEFWVVSSTRKVSAASSSHRLRPC